MKTYMARKGELEQKWYLVDASEQVLGRLATRIASILMGKHKPEYTPHVDTGDFVVVVNAAEVRITGANKPREKLYQRYSGYPSGRNVETFQQAMAKDPARVMTLAVRRMLPKNKLGAAMLKKLKVYPGAQHPHQAQEPERIDL